MMRKRHLAIVGVTLSALTMAVCSVTPSFATTTKVKQTHPKLWPVTIGLIYNSNSGASADPDVATGAEAAAKYVNNTLNGFNGHLLKIDVCGDNNDPTTDTNCARRFVAEGALAVIGLSPVWGSAGIPVVAAAKIPSMTSPISGPEFTNADSFPFVSGATASQTAALVYYFTKVKPVTAGATLSVAYPTAVAGLQAGWVNPMKAAGVNMSAIVQQDPTAADYSSAIETADTGNPGVIFMAFAEANCAQVLTQAATLGIKTTWASYGSCGSPALLATDGAAANGLTISQDTYLPTQTSNADVATFQKAMKLYKKGQPLSGQALDSFSDVVTLQRIMKQTVKSGAPRSAQLLSWLNGNNVVPIFAGATYGKANAVAPYTQVYNNSLRIVQVQNGKFVDIGGGWVNGITGQVTK